MMLLTGVPYPAVRRGGSSGVGSYNQLPLTVIDNSADETVQSQDTPVDFSVTNRSTLSTETTVNNSTATQLKGFTVFPNRSIEKLAASIIISIPVWSRDDICFNSA